MSENDRIDGRKLFESHYHTVEDIIRFVSRRHRLGVDEREDFTSYAMLKLIEGDYRRVRQYRGDSTFKTYLSVVLQRLFLDYRTQKWGKWRPSTMAVRLGSLAVQLETLMHRDGYEFHEASETLLASSGTAVSEEALWELARKLPFRERPKLVDEDFITGVEGMAPRDELARAEKLRMVKELEERLSSILDGMSAEDRLILRMRFDESMTVPDIAEALKLEVKALYARIARLLKRMRSELEALGLAADSIQELWGFKELEIDFGRIFADSSSGPSNPQQASV